jgi:hypothetical protein
VEEEEYPGPESSEPSDPTVPHSPSAPPASASRERPPRGRVVGEAITSRGAGWFVASILAGAVTALSILVAAGPQTAVQYVSASGSTPLRQAAPRYVQVVPGQRAVAFPGTAKVRRGRSYTIVGGGGGPFGAVGPGGGPFGIGGPGCPAMGAVRPGGVGAIYLSPKAARVARLKTSWVTKLPAGKQVTISLKGRRVVMRRALRMIQIFRSIHGKRVTISLGRAPGVVQIFRSVHGKSVVTRVLAPQAIAGRCTVNFQVVAPPGKGR